MIVAVQDQKDSSIRALVVIPGSGMCKAGFTGDLAPRAVFSLPPLVRPTRSAPWPVWTRLTVMLWCLWFRLQKTVESPQLQSIMVVDISCRGADADSHGPFYHRATCTEEQCSSLLEHLRALPKSIGPRA